MRVFVTGATGFIGSTIVPELIAGGHTVLGLTRSDAGAASLVAAGAEVRRGSLEDLQALRGGAAASDGVIHTAYNHDWSITREVASETDREAVEAIAGALGGSGKPFVVTSGTLMVALPSAGRTATEEDASENAALPRVASEIAVQAAAALGVRASVVRLAPTVHGAGDHGFVPTLISIARRTGISAFVGDGANRWPAVHRLDAAGLFRLALEKGAPGARFHGAAEEGVPMRAIADAIGQGLGIPVRSIAPGKAQRHFDWLAPFVVMDNPTSSAITRKSLGWRPREAELLTDLRDGGYFSDVNTLVARG